LRAAAFSRRWVASRNRSYLLYQLSWTLTDCRPASRSDRSDSALLGDELIPG
jgi:hypothetical protein